MHFEIIFNFLLHSFLGYFYFYINSKIKFNFNFNVEKNFQCFKNKLDAGHQYHRI